MQPGARLVAAIEVLQEVVGRGRPASLALSDWGRSHRFAGSGDRGAIGNLVYDALRKKHSVAHAMGSDAPRALVLGILRFGWSLSADAIAAQCSGSAHDPDPLSPDESAALSNSGPPSVTPWVAGDYPEWLHPSFLISFGDDAVSEGRALASRAPVDLRVNTLKSTRDKLLKAFVQFGATPTPFSPIGVRLPPRNGPARSPNVEADPAHGRGWFEVQDEGSQIAAQLAGAEPRYQVADICAGAGGKTLAFAAAMQNTGQIYAYDSDASRFRPIFERMKRAGARNIQTLQPGDEASLAAMANRMDLVLVDAPCSGSGVWRRRPDAKWRLTASQLEERKSMQATVLSLGGPLVKPGGVLAYVTCSVLPEENQMQIASFLAANPDFHVCDTIAAQSRLLMPLPSPARASPGILLTPHRHDTDGFYIALLRRVT